MMMVIKKARKIDRIRFNDYFVKLIPQILIDLDNR